MIRNRTWRGVARGTVVAADLVVLLVAGAAVPSALPFALGVLVVATTWGLSRPGGWGGFALVVAQVLCVGVLSGAPEKALDWALTAVASAAVVLCHLALTLLGSWPTRTDLPEATALRWTGQAAVLVWVAVAAALLGALATRTPLGWAPWLGAGALALVAATVWQVRAGTRRD